MEVIIIIKVNILETLEVKERNIKWLADKTGINYSTLYNFVHGKSKTFNLESLYKIIKILDVNVEDILKVED